MATEKDGPAVAPHVHMAAPNSQKQTEPDDPAYPYDVFATPFVPAVLRAINKEEPKHIINTEVSHTIDYSFYTSSFAARSFLPSRPIYPSGSLNESVSPGNLLLCPADYLTYFQDVWRTELAAHTPPELYNVNLTYLGQYDHASHIYSFCVPGLRENNPLVERGDTICLRKLTFGVHWHPPNAVQHVWMGPWSSPHLQASTRAWTGIQYNTSAYSINRREELVLVRVSGLDPGSAANFASGPINVVIPPKQRFVQAQQNALYLVHNRLISIGVQNSDGQNDWNNPIAIDNAHQSENDWIRRMTFPVEADGFLQTTLRKIPKDRGLVDAQCNYEQIQAVDTACKANFGVLPFLISGVPGAGKTKTLVELALQLLATTNVAHILICAPSDQAADTLAIRLRKVLPPEELLRLIGPQRADDEVPGELLPYCYRERDMFYIPPFRQLMAYKVVVTSTRDVSILAEARLTNSDLYSLEKSFQSAFNPGNHKAPVTLHWGALIMDEAAQATEIDALPALSVVMPPAEYSLELEQPRFIMAGDEKQLGPKSDSKDPRYVQSLFARLLKRPLYADHPLSRSRIRPSTSAPVLTSSMLPMLYPPFTNLLRNYRSHPAILSVPSSLFYSDTLIPEAPIESNTPLQSSTLWQGKRWPVLYIPTYGEDDLEREGGGWYNISEVQQACKITGHLVTECSIPQRDIAIIAPFAAQVKRLRDRFRRDGLWEVNIGPLEAFQGLESKILVVCTTRTRERFLDEDIRRDIGIIGLKRKMNVALTRAKDALFVLGSAKILARDQHWCAFLAYCWRNGLVLGAPFNEDMVNKFRNHKIGVLERVLCLKDNYQDNLSKSLGSKAQGCIYGSTTDDQMWAAASSTVFDHSTSEELDEYTEDEEYDGEHYDEEPALDGAQEQ